MPRKLMEFQFDLFSSPRDPEIEQVLHGRTGPR